MIKMKTLIRKNIWSIAGISCVCCMLVVLLTSCSNGKSPQRNAAYYAALQSLDWGTDTCYVYGHNTPDVDAVTSALAYAKLMRSLGYNCVAKVSGPMNRETQYIARRLGFALPELKTTIQPGTRLIITDHSEYLQCVDGASEAIILQKIDHHTEGDIKDADVPFVRREMVGSTNTIVYDCYNQLGVPIDDEAAKIMLAGIVSDTHNLSKSLTCQADSNAWEALATQLGLLSQMDEISRSMIEASYNYDGMTDAEIFLSDYKDYEVNGHAFGIGNITSMQTDVEQMINRMLAVMPEVMAQKDSQMLFGLIDTMVPNPDFNDKDKPYVKRGSYFIYSGEGVKDVAESVVGQSIREGVTYSPRNLSRKTDVVPFITQALEKQ